MKLILLAISLFFAGNTYAGIINDLYIYQDDSNEVRVLKEKIGMLKKQQAELNLIAFKSHMSGYQRYAKDEVVYRVGDTSKKDVGAKIGMTKEQVMNKTHWGKPESIHTIIDRGDILDAWTYDIFGDRNGITQSTGSLYFINGKLTHRISGLKP
uniref:hypothetical protein n=1 Tax=Psychrobacter sp. TaxID=56811 RepID=UPI0015EEF7D6|nr:hypothetical protein [Psychrobacter sp.]